MLLNWFTVGAQALNFLILVWLMKRFLYKPIRQAIDAREKRIADELAHADSTKADAQKARDEFQKKNEQFDKERDEMFAKVTRDAAAEREKLMASARQDADAIAAKRQQMLATDARNLQQTIHLSMQQEVFAIAKKALADLATTSLEERIADVFTRRLRAMDAPAKQALLKAYQASPDGALLRTAFELPASQRATVQNALNETLSAAVRIRFEIAPELVAGIELTIGGQKVAWSLADYLDALQVKTNEMFHNSAAKDGTSTPKVTAPSAQEMAHPHAR